MTTHGIDTRISTNRIVPQALEMVLLACGSTVGKSSTFLYKQSASPPPAGTSPGVDWTMSMLLRRPMVSERCFGVASKQTQRRLGRSTSMISSGGFRSSRAERSLGVGSFFPQQENLSARGPPPNITSLTPNTPVLPASGPLLPRIPAIEISGALLAIFKTKGTATSWKCAP